MFFSHFSKHMRKHIVFHKFSLKLRRPTRIENGRFARERYHFCYAWLIALESIVFAKRYENQRRSLKICWKSKEKVRGSEEQHKKVTKQLRESIENLPESIEKPNEHV